MSHKLMIVLLSAAFAFGNVSARALSATDPPATDRTQPVQRGNQAPLAPAGAASITQAQGFTEDYPFLSAAIGFGVVTLVLILLDNDDIAAPSTGTN
jgi:hypothetical protein